MPPTRPARGPADAPAAFAARCLVLAREAHAAGRHETAYHALAAAMHAAHDERDGAALSAIAREGETQIAWLDRHAPDHRLSTRSAGRHAHPGVFHLLVRQCGAYQDMLRPRLATPLAGAAGRRGAPGDAAPPPPDAGR